MADGKAIKSYQINIRPPFIFLIYLQKIFITIIVFRNYLLCFESYSIKQSNQISEKLSGSICRNRMWEKISNAIKYKK